MSLGDRVPDGASVLVDTSPIIYLLEGSPLFGRFASLFEAVDSGRISALVTPITLAEVVTGPLRAGKDALAERYRRAISASRGWSLCELGAEVAMLAARLRLRHKLKLPDAFQLAAAIHEGCHALVTHDRDFSSVKDVPILSG